MYICVSVYWYAHMTKDACKARKRTLGTLELELWVVVSLQIWILAIERCRPQEHLCLYPFDHLFSPFTHQLLMFLVSQPGLIGKNTVMGRMKDLSGTRSKLKPANM